MNNDGTFCRLESSGPWAGQNEVLYFQQNVAAGYSSGPMINGFDIFHRHNL